MFFENLRDSQKNSSSVVFSLYLATEAFHTEDQKREEKIIYNSCSWHFLCKGWLKNRLMSKIVRKIARKVFNSLFRHKSTDSPLYRTGITITFIVKSHIKIKCCFVNKSQWLGNISKFFCRTFKNGPVDFSGWSC